MFYLYIKTQIAIFSLARLSIINWSWRATVDEMVGNVLADKVIDFLAKNTTRLYDVVDLVQQELEQWNVELVYKTKFYA